MFVALNQRLNEVITEATSNIRPGRTVGETARRYVESVFKACEENRDLVRLVVLNADPGSEPAKRMRDADTDRNKPLTSALARGMCDGTVREGDPVIMADIVRGAVSMAVYQAFVVSNGTHAQQYRDACADMLSAYLTPGTA